MDRCIQGARALGQSYITWPLIDPDSRTIDKFKLEALTNMKQTVDTLTKEVEKKFDIDFDWGPSNSDRRHRFVASWLYELPGMQHARVLRSPHPHARLLRIDTSRAEQLFGFRARTPLREGIAALGQDHHHRSRRQSGRPHRHWRAAK